MSDKILSEESLQNIDVINQQLSKHAQVLFSIGYEGKSIDTFINILLKNDIKLLCDVRWNPFSRKFGFSKKQLQHILGNMGIDYIHIPTLGIESAERQSLETLDDYNALFERYKNSLPSKTKELHQVYSMLQSNGRIALMCYEQDPNYCHRTIIKDYLVSNYHLESEDL